MKYRRRIHLLTFFPVLYIITVLSCSENTDSATDSFSTGDVKAYDYSEITDMVFSDEIAQDTPILTDKGILTDIKSADTETEEDSGSKDIYDVIEHDVIIIHDTGEDFYTADYTAEDFLNIWDIESESGSEISDVNNNNDDIQTEDSTDSETISDLNICTPICGQDSCGQNDGCGGICTGCPDGKKCNTNTWQCETICQPSCNLKECGDDGCGNECPPGCSPGQTCINGKCQGCSGEKYGQDYDLTRRCARTVCDTSSSYYYEDKTGCTSQSSWLIAVESEASLGASCPGPANCSFKINDSQSPVLIEWFTHKSDCGDNWSVHMLVDHSKYPSPCSGDYWTWFAFMDHQQTGGGPYPPATDTVSHHTLNFSSYTPTPDTSARVFIGGQWWWGGKARMIEFNLNLQQWGDADPHPGLIVRFDTPEFEFLALDASYWGLNIIQGQDTTVEIPWGRILQDSVSLGWLASPSVWSDVIPMAYFIGIEIKNNAIGSLWHTDFRIMKK